MQSIILFVGIILGIITGAVSATDTSIVNNTQVTTGEGPRYQ